LSHLSLSLLFLEISSKAAGPQLYPVRRGGWHGECGGGSGLNDMLVRAPGGRYIVLFPMWPATQPASFTTLRTKGGFLVSASWDPHVQAVADPVEITATVTGNCTLQNPWALGRRDGAASPVIHCPDQRSASADGADRVTWAMRAGETCILSPGDPGGV